MAKRWSTTMGGLRYAAVAIGMAATMFAGEGAQALTPARVVTGSASAILVGLAPQWAAAFQRSGGRVQFKPSFGPPQGALDPNLAEFLDGHLDFALLTREIAESDLARFRSHHGGRNPRIIPVAGGSWQRFGYVDAVVFVVHPSNPLSYLDYRRIDAIFTTTRWQGGTPAATWGDLGRGGAWHARPINLVGGGAWSVEESARALTVRRRILSCGGRVGVWRQSPSSGNDQDVVERVASDPAAIGFTGLGHVTKAVRVVPIARPGRAAVLPNARTAANGRYPLVRTVDLLIDSTASPATLAFARFLLSSAGQQAIVRQGDFMPLPTSTRHASIRKVEALKLSRTMVGELDLAGQASCWTAPRPRAQRSAWLAFS